MQLRKWPDNRIPVAVECIVPSSCSAVVAFCMLRQVLAAGWGIGTVWTHWWNESCGRGMCLYSCLPCVLIDLEFFVNTMFTGSSWLFLWALWVMFNSFTFLGRPGPRFTSPSVLVIEGWFKLEWVFLFFMDLLVSRIIHCDSAKGYVFQILFNRQLSWLRTTSFHCSWFFWVFL